MKITIQFTEEEVKSFEEVRSLLGKSNNINSLNIENELNEQFNSFIDDDK